MKRIMKKGPDLLTYRAESIMLDLVKVEDPDEILNDASAKDMNQL